MGVRGVRMAALPVEPFNESAAQVKRLISRDRKEFMGNQADILEKYENEFGPSEGERPLSDRPTPAFVVPPAPVVSKPKPAPAKPLSSSAASNPFGAPAAPVPLSKAVTQPFKQSIEPVGLRPDMGPDPIQQETPFNFLANITLTQVAIVASFSLVILLMIGTFFFVLKVGGVRLNGV
eukprot:CAMPEP_0119107692 /NCGR_PEP_ID=MMETSP1180-20130426/11544_1 /TAXON_ID=3052 ORGANISM="Chlamydomonas cf sp, Strain CCMP681" /NCGR_SAMPLE_ID=MMETSP1180 /ASSEMBLY_ACC=CAM_ASM_000741 /LENGTH=177 /DNA_ID=CAMNT_0007093211 /DNA_START=123 /DNA_END=656 /DNA_ORIENTATION=+